MKTGWLITMALLLGLLIAGLTNAALVSMLPEQLRGAPIVWLVTTFIVLGALAVVWRIARRSPR